MILFALLLALLYSFPASSGAQTKKSGSKKRAATPAPTPVMDMRAEANQVAEQIKNITKFLFIYGKVANSLEFAEDQAKRGQVSTSVAEKNKQGKDALVASVNGLRTGLDNLVKSFQANSRLQVQYLKLSYAAESLANAEKFAINGQYDEAGKSMIASVERLTDTLTSMRLQ
jgi:hypothetical protein